MTDLNERLANLSPEKKALLMQQLAKQSPKRKKNEIGRRQRPDRIPLSFAQQRLWVLDQLEPGSATYNVPHAMWIQGQPNIDVLQRTLLEIMNRHEVLRTVIGSDEHGPFQSVQTVQTVDEFTIVRHDLTGTDPATQEETAHQIAIKDAAQAFDLATGPLLRAALITLDNDRHLFLMNAHHIAVDGWSYNVIFSELCSLYDAFSKNEPSPLPALTTQYIDYSLWQRELLAEGSETLNKQLDYWQEKLSGQLPVLELPNDRPRPAVQSNRGAVYCYKVPKSSYTALKQMSQQFGVTTFMAFAAALQTLLSRYSGQEDIILGVGVANRRLQELESLVGFFVNTLALRVDLSGDPAFATLLERVKEDMLAADSHQDIPVERLLDGLDVDRSMSHSPLFQAMLFFQNYPAQDVNLTDLTISPVEPGSIHAGVSRSDLTVFAGEDDKGLALYFEYATDLFDQESIASMAQNLVQLIDSAVADPKQRLSKLNMLPQSEQNKLLNTWNTTQTTDSSNCCIHQLFQKQARTTPDAIAIRHNAEAVTYQQLDQQSDKLAVRLLNSGVKQGEKVGLFVNRSPNMLVGLLGILKAGASYIPLDPNFPNDRIEFMLTDAQSRFVVSERSLTTFFNQNLSRMNLNIIAVDGEQNHGSEEVQTQDQQTETSAQTPVLPNVDAQSTAYVIFTSGTTGRPKGVLISHQAAVNFLRSMAQVPGINANDTICAVTTLSFDIAVLELLLPLTVGASIELADSHIAADAIALSQLLDKSAATMMQATPTTWRMLIDSGWQGFKTPANSSQNKTPFKILSGGEPLSQELAKDLIECCDQLWNMYGPTETTIWSTVAQIKPDVNSIHVGRPIANTQVYILDKHQQLVPTGVPGELHIGGAGVAQGYLQRPDLTAEKFIHNPYENQMAQQPGSTLYRTGDLAKWTREGHIEILGRIDHQVKIRGFRIELGEIESVINEHERVKQAIVICREDRPGDKRLVAYLLATTAIEDLGEIQSQVKTKLPDYMHPSAYVILDEFPQTPNGKIDRKALPKPEMDDLSSQQYCPPRNDEEQQLVELWASILGLEQVGIHDDFFKLGGHSLLATQLITQIQKTFHCDVTLRNLFEYPTVAQLAEFMLAEQLKQVDESALDDMLNQLDDLSEEALQALLEQDGGDPQPSPQEEV